MLKICQHGDCMKEIGSDGLIVTLKTETFYGEKRAGFCCAAHAAGALTRLAMDRDELTEKLAIPARWRVT